jgi:hypothetical protein
MSAMGSNLLRPQVADSRGSPWRPIAAVEKPGFCREGQLTGAVANSHYRPQRDGRASSSIVRSRRVADVQSRQLADRRRPKPARGGLVVEWPVYFVSGRSQISSSNAEFGGSSRCRITAGGFGELQPNGRTSKRRQCANDPKRTYDFASGFRARAGSYRFIRTRISTRAPTASAYFSIVLSVGRVHLPLSRRDTTLLGGPHSRGDFLLRHCRRPACSYEIGHQLLQCAIGLERPCTPFLALSRH